MLALRAKTDRGVSLGAPRPLRFFPIPNPTKLEPKVFVYYSPVIPLG
uniref:Uncharacterized protein n=1 Tax=Candidatus Kentrum sp. LPFa TaxID=2126335 RepID=A0A450W2Y7_9GAMM|nr:MAG: hypothetical protein BECKLPF1236A_GA0070988_1005111 [Candidatus Kentron sp. LPFa]VFK26299.1 MAG: hypothetical protein BECKLPF1236C_GA0070990_1003311 [Candidatus Kentron sp. LPFa]